MADAVEAEFDCWLSFILAILQRGNQLFFFLVVVTSKIFAIRFVTSI